MSGRRLAREIVVQTLYEMEMAQTQPRLALRANLERRPGGDDTARHAARLLDELQQNRTAVQEAIRPALANWSWERVAIVDRCVLEVATVELLRFPDVPWRVVLDEAVRVARKFGGPGSGAFVNGVLDRVARALDDSRGTARPES